MLVLTSRTLPLQQTADGILYRFSVSKGEGGVFLEILVPSGYMLLATAHALGGRDIETTAGDVTVRHGSARLGAAEWSKRLQVIFRSAIATEAGFVIVPRGAA